MAMEWRFRAAQFENETSHQPIRNCTRFFRSMERGLLLAACLCSQTAKHRSTSFCYLTRAIFFVSHFFRFLGPSFTRKSARFSTFAECDDSRDPRDKRRKCDGKLGTGKVTYDEEEDGVNKFQALLHLLSPHAGAVLGPFRPSTSSSN